MRLRSQSIGFVAIAACVGFLLVTAIALGILLPEADREDEDQMSLRISRMESRLAQEAEKLRLYADEYGPWTETFEFASGRQPTYDDTYFNSDTLRVSGMNVVMIWNAEGRLLMARGYDPHLDQMRTLPEGTTKAIERNSRWREAAIGVASLGWVDTPQGLLLFGVEGITKDDRQPPLGGWFLAGQFFTREMLNRVVAGEDHSASMTAPGSALDDPPIRMLDGSRITGRLVLRDPTGQPAAELHLTAPRLARLREERSLRLVLLSLAVAAALGALSAWRWMDRRLLSRIEALTRDVARLEEDPEARARLATTVGIDEIAALGRDTGRMAAKLADSRLAAEEATRAKSEFLATMSHEIRTPLNGVIGYLELLRETPLTPEQESHVRTIEESGNALLGVINEILDYSKLESGRIALETVPVNLRSIAQEALAVFLPKLRMSGVQASVAISEGVPKRLFADPLRLRQVLTNLLSNAVKFTASGSIRIQVDPLESAERGLRGVRFSVIDTGIGISERERATLFEPFAQADSSTTRRYGGTGLGLAICRKLVTAWGGEISVDSKPGEGSTFTFTLPGTVAEMEGGTVTASPFAEPPASGETPGERSPLRILIAEDNDVNSRLLSAMLARCGYEADIVANGCEALDAMEHTAYDLVLMDVQMPEMDGLETTRVQRQRESRAGRRPVLIVALTANAMTGAREECMAAGMDDYLAKPFQLAQVRLLLKRACRRRA